MKQHQLLVHKTLLDLKKLPYIFQLNHVYTIFSDPNRLEDSHIIFRKPQKSFYLSTYIYLLNFQFIIFPYNLKSDGKMVMFNDIIEILCFPLSELEYSLKNCDSIVLKNNGSSFFSVTC